MRAFRVIGWAAVAAGLALLDACGGGGGVTPTSLPTPAPTPPPAVRNVIHTGRCEGLGVDVLCFFDPVTTTQKGDLDVTVDWTFPEDLIQVMVSFGPCTLDQINNSQCSMATTSLASATPKPRVLTLRGMAAGTYQLYVGNRGPRTESVSVQVGLTTGGAASVAAIPGRLEIVRPYASSVAAR